MKQRKTEENFHRRMDEIYGEKSNHNGRLESRIPVPQYRDREISMRHSTAYHRRKKDDDVYQATSSAPQTSSGQRHDSDVNDVEIARRYRGDRLRQPSRPGSQERARFEQQRDSSTPDTIVDNRRRRSVVQSIFPDHYHDSLSPSRVGSRRNSAISQRNNSASLSVVQKPSRSRRLSNAQLIQGEKSNIDDEENLNEINRRHVSAQANSYRIQNLSDQSTQCSGCDQVPFQVSNSSSNCSVDNQSIQDNQSSSIHIDNDDDIIIAPTRNSFSEKSFDIITGESNPSRHNSIDQIAQSVVSSDSADLEKETSSDDQQYIHDNKIIDKHEIEQADSSSSVVSNETNSTESINRIIQNNLQNNNQIKNYEFDEHDHPGASLIYNEEYSNNVEDDIESRMIASICPDEKTQFKPTDIRMKDQDNISERRSSSVSNSVSIFSTSRPHSRATSQLNDITYEKIDNNNHHDDNNDEISHEKSSSVLSASREFDENENFDAISIVTNQSFTELPDNLDIDSLIVGKTYRSIQSSSDNITTSKILETDVNKIPQSKVPRIKVKPRIGTNKVAPISQINHHVDNKIPVKSKTAILQCFSQLESTEWEVTIKGLKALSIIARQRPEQLETCPPGTLGRLLGRHVKNLRSQVARTACLAAGDVFESQTKCLDQELDDIAGPLLQRTADTNKFLRADSNAALDRMIEHLSPQKTVAVIVYRGASHQNAIVRAASARLLLSIVDRVGPDIVMILPRDIRDKFLSASAKLIMDGNLDARNNAKKMFKKLSRWDGFRRALKDSVPETTLRHIDKTLRSL
ncbi:uncharacterized protein LOC122851213 isoform X1 [Aphidius gifuensis]|nr:uncharacterized protein LOC122851213 isoform X1 [Aphidius gifuensis]